MESNDHGDGDLPEWLLLEILKRLPIKSIFKFKTISNRWNSLISDPCFNKFYLSHRITSTSSSLPWTLVTRYTPWDVSDKIFQGHKLDRLCCDDYKSPDFSVPDFPDPRLHKPYQGATIATSNGLLLCREWDPYIYKHYVCNPLTKQWVTLAPYDTNGKGTIHYTDGFITQVDQGGIVTSYKVVLPPKCHELTTTHILNMDIFASETGNWRCIQVNCPESIRIPLSVPPILFNGILHWLTDGFEIVAYDPYHDMEGCRIIKEPSRNTSHSTDNHRCWRNQMGVCQGHLLYVIMLSNRFEVWVLQDYDSGKWHFEHCIGYDDIWLGRGLSPRPRHDQYLIPLAVHPFDSTILYFSYKKQVLCYNIRSKKLELLHNRQSIFCWQVFEQGSVVTFVLPPWPSPIPLMGSHNLS